MFTGLIDDAKNIRTPLFLGYMVVISLWLIIGNEVPTRTSAVSHKDPVIQLANRAFSDLGSVSRIGLLTFSALLVGNLLERFFVSVGAFERLWARFDMRIQKTEELRMESPYIQNDQGLFRASDMTSSSMRHLPPIFERNKKDLEFRLVLIFSPILPMATATCLGGRRWLPMFFLLLVPIADAYQLSLVLKQNRREISRLQARNDLYLACVNTHGQLSLRLGGAEVKKLELYEYLQRSQSLAGRVEVLRFEEKPENSSYRDLCDAITDLRNSTSLKAEISKGHYVTDLDAVEGAIDSLERVLSD